MNNAHTLALTVSYDGTDFSGFARQRTQTTVQGEIERALAVVLGRDIETACAGRTDAGVHALGQVVSFGITQQEAKERLPEKFCRALNALMPSTVVIRDASLKPLGFSSRFDAISREYRYRIVEGQIAPLFLKRVAWWVRIKGVLDIEEMRAAAVHLIGEHDFKSFCVATSAQGKTTMRNVSEIELYEEVQLGERCLVIRVVGNAFLHSMVRTMVGSLVDVGCKRRSSDWMLEVLAAQDRCTAGQKAPAHGLTFWKVTYPEH